MGSHELHIDNLNDEVDRLNNKIARMREILDEICEAYVPLDDPMKSEVELFAEVRAIIGDD